MKKHIAEFVADEWFPEIKFDTTNKSGNLPNNYQKTYNQAKENKEGLTPQAKTGNISSI